MATEKKQGENMQNKYTTTNGVVITIYTESPKTRSSKLSQNSHFRMPQTTETHGYDRRAQLLAYSRQLRENARSEKKVQVQSPRNSSRFKSKKRLLVEPVRICSPRFKHECVEHKGIKEIIRSKKKKGRENKCCQFLRKLRNMLKKLSCKEIKG